MLFKEKNETNLILFKELNKCYWMHYGVGRNKTNSLIKNAIKF